jgi:hypothetical protein
MEATGIHSYNCFPIMFAMILMTVWQSAHTCRLFMMSSGVLSVLITLCMQWPVSCYRGTNRKTFLLPHSTNFVSGTPPASCICHTISSVWYGIQWSYNGLAHIQNIAHTLPFTSIQMWHGHHYHNIVSHPLPFIIIQHFLRTQLQAQQQHRCLISAHCLNLFKCCYKATKLTDSYK